MRTPPSRVRGKPHDQSLLHRWVPRILLIGASLAFAWLQLHPPGSGTPPTPHHPTSHLPSSAALRAAASPASMAGSGVGGGGGGGGSGLVTAPSSTSATTTTTTTTTGGGRKGVCYESENLAACREWRDSILPTQRVDIVLVANELFQQFPLTGYGGIETSVENIASALHRMGIPFWVITPGRKERPPYPFDVLETAIAPNGQGGHANTFVEEALEVIRNRGDGTGAGLVEVDKWHRMLRSAPDGPGGAGSRPLVIWGQSDWSQSFSEAAIATITSHHDGGGPMGMGHLAYGKWDRHIKTVGHRFLSFDQRKQWIAPDDARNIPRSRVIPHGLPPDDFFLCQDGGYFLWVAGLDWGWEEKGLHIFTALARAHPDMRFVAYGVATKRHDLEDRLRALSVELPNFEFKGQLKRGHVHKKVFCEATAFFMPTQPSIGESFGMTVIESLSKGVPVIASTAGAVPEILDVPGRHGFSPYGAACNTMEEYEEALQKFKVRDPKQGALIQAYAKSKYDSHVVVNDLLQFSLDVAVGVGALKQYPHRDWHKLLEEEAAYERYKSKGWLGKLLFFRKRPLALWNRIGLVLHAVCAVATLLATRPCKARMMGGGGSKGGGGMRGGRLMCSS